MHTCALFLLQDGALEWDWCIVGELIMELPMPGGPYQNWLIFGKILI